MPIYKYVNKDFFKVWTPNMAYVLGFFAADGYMTKNKRGAHFWNIQITDKELLEDIKRAISAEHKISERQRKGNEKPLYRLQIGSKEMYADLRSLGFTQGKTKSLAVPNVPAKFFRDFVRGYFDGDGNVWIGKQIRKNRDKSNISIRASFTSSSVDFLSEIHRRLRLFGLITGFIEKGDTYSRLHYSVKSSLKLYDFMYNHPVVKSDSLFLHRKRIVFEKYISMRP